MTHKKYNNNNPDHLATTTISLKQPTKATQSPSPLNSTQLKLKTKIQHNKNKKSKHNFVTYDEHKLFFNLKRLTLQKKRSKKSKNSSIHS